VYAIGDAHGKLNRLSKILREINDTVVCVGDVGIGFYNKNTRPYFRKNFRAIRGNHDNPFWANLHPQFLPDYGMLDDVFFIAGARSVDVILNNRVEGKDWWRDEELSMRQCYEALALYKESKPRIVISHDCPFSLHGQMKELALLKDPGVAVFGDPTPYNQVLMMDEMFRYHQPEMWLFGHWHVSAGFEVDGTYFRCLDELEVIEIPEKAGTES
jgi:hypothetical protein